MKSRDKNALKRANRAIARSYPPHMAARPTKVKRPALRMAAEQYDHRRQTQRQRDQRPPLLAVLSVNHCGIFLRRYRHYSFTVTCAKCAAGTRAAPGRFNVFVGGHARQVTSSVGE